MTETPILDESAVSEIEARAAYVNTRFEEKIILTPAERDALCATVKHLRAESKELPLKGYWPALIDRGDGVPGHFCIGQLIKPDQPYWEFWNKGQWTSAGEVFIGREAAQRQLDAIRVGDEIDLLDNDAVDQELRRWQDAIRNKLIDLGAPDWKIDGAGCDSGDPLDFTLAEVGQGVGYFLDQIESLQSQLEQLRAENEVLGSEIKEKERGDFDWKQSRP